MKGRYFSVNSVLYNRVFSLLLMIYCYHILSTCQISAASSSAVVTPNELKKLFGLFIFTVWFFGKDLFWNVHLKVYYIESKCLLTQFTSQFSKFKFSSNFSSTIISGPKLLLKSLFRLSEFSDFVTLWYQVLKSNLIGFAFINCLDELN